MWGDGTVAGRLAARLVAALVLLCALDAAIFRTPIYHGILDPRSSTGSFEAMLSRQEAAPPDVRRGVLVIGDSRIVEALWPGPADRAAAGLRFINAAIPGTTPRCWYYFLRDLDPQARRYRAIVVPFDTYDDDNSAIGALDAADHIADLHYVVYRLRASDWIDFAMSMQWNRANALLGEIFRGLTLKDDVQALLSAPRARLAMLGSPDAIFPGDDYRGRTATLAGLHMSPRGLIFPSHITPDVRAEVTRRVLDPPAHNAMYAAYRRLWIGRILARYAGSQTRIIFVRVPAAPLILYRNASDPLSSVRELARQYGAIMLPDQLFADLERPRYFSDHAHMNAQGRLQFSKRFGAEIAKVLDR
jgi:hypothetical protein